MSRFALSLRRSCVAFVVQTFGRFHPASAFTSTTRNSRTHCPHDGATTKGCYVRLASSTAGLETKIDFEPPEPPGTHGTPVFPDIELSKTIAAASQARNNDPNAVFVVTGASRGLGREFVRQLLSRTQGTIVACCRSPEDCAEMVESSKPGRIHVVQLDLEHQTTIEEAGELLRERYSRVDVLLNVAGMLGNAKTTPGPERSISAISRPWFEQTMAVNLIGPVMLTKEVFSLLKQPRNQQERPKSMVVNLSARVGSISDNQLGGWYSYRMSKTALNQATRTMSLELQRHHALAISLHPGTTQTDLSAPFERNVKPGSLFPVEFTVSQLLQVIDCASDEHSGGFYDWAGKSISF